MVELKGILAVAAVNAVYSDIFSKPKHQVVFGSIPGHAPITPSTLATLDLESDPTLLLLPDASTGNTYLCHVPPPLETAEEPSKADSPDEKRKTIKSALALLEPLSKQSCLYYVHNWWTYEFCHNQHVRQFHQRTKEEEQANPDQKQDYILGRFSETTNVEKPKVTKDVDVVKAVVETEERAVVSFKGSEVLEHEMDGKSVTYLKQVWEDGTFCDEVQAPRKIEIQYLCNAYTEQIVTIREVASCQYLINIQTPKLCTDPVFVPKELDQGTSIICEPVLPVELLGRPTYTPPQGAHAKNLLGTRAMIEVEELAKAKAAGFGRVPARGLHSIQAKMERIERKAMAAAAMSAKPKVGLDEASVYAKPRVVAGAGAGVGTGATGGAKKNGKKVVIKFDADEIEAAAGIAAEVLGGGIRDPALDEIVKSKAFAEAVKAMSQKMVDAFGDVDLEGLVAGQEEILQAVKPTAAAGAGVGRADGDQAVGEEADDLELEQYRHKRFAEVLELLQNGMGLNAEGQPNMRAMVLTDDGRLILKEDADRAKKAGGGAKKEAGSGKKGKRGNGKQPRVKPLGNGPNKRGIQIAKGNPPGKPAKRQPPAKVVPPEPRSPDDDDELEEEAFAKAASGERSPEELFGIFAKSMEKVMKDPEQMKEFMKTGTSTQGYAVDEKGEIEWGDDEEEEE
ncbi:Protein OS-9 [Phlyctochytrium planicorne]|nr:Protein OS-9 [Phlyctochytrium planicorne]